MKEGVHVHKVMIVEDDEALSNGVALALKSVDISIIQYFDIKTAKQHVCKPLDLIILDINLPDGNGFDFLQEIKKQFNIPVIMLTANDMETDIVSGLEMGADDYITKPFSLAVLRARVNTQLRKQSSLHQDSYKQGGFVFDFSKMEFFKNQNTIELSKTEQKLLRILITRRGNIVERGVLVDSVWTEVAEYVDENALSVTIKRLRDKLEDAPSKPKFIKTIYGIGYTWAVE